MSIETRKGRFFVCYRPDGRYGRRVRVPIPTGQDPRRWHDSFIREWKEAKGRPTERPLTGFTVSQLWPEYLEWSKLHHAETTHADLVSAGRRLLKHLGQYDAESLGAHHVGLYQRLRTADVGRTYASAINKDISYLFGFVRWAGKQGHITPRKIPVDPLPYKRPLPQVLTVGEVKAFLKACDPFFRAYFLTLYALGLRRVEARGLRWQDIDFKRGTIRVVQKGGSQKVLPAGKGILSALRSIAPPRRKFKEIGGSLPVFQHPVSQYRNPGHAVINLKPAIQRACAKAGITKRVTPHLFRHSYATHLVDADVNLRTVQRLLGHSRIATTEIYTHVSMETMRSAQHTIDAGLAARGHNKPRQRSVWTHHPKLQVIKSNR